MMVEAILCLDSLWIDSLQVMCRGLLWLNGLLECSVVDNHLEIEI